MSRSDFRFNGVVRLTRIGAGYLAFTFLIAFAALNTGNNSLYIGLAFMLGALLISGVASKGGLRHLKVEVSHIDQAWAGKPVAGVLQISNDSRLWNVRDVVVTSGEVSRPSLLAILNRRSETSIPVTFSFARRGRAELRQLDLYTRYPFALFLKKRRVKISSDLVVYPKLVEGLPGADARAPEPGDAAQSNRMGLGAELYGFREYVRGDSVRQIHWKKSASLGRWILKESEAEIDRAVYLFIDAHLPANRKEQDFEDMISAATTLIRDLLRDGAQVTITAGGLTLSGHSEQNARALFETMALLESTPERGALPDETEAMIFTLRDR